MLLQWLMDTKLHKIITAYDVLRIHVFMYGTKVFRKVSRILHCYSP